MISEKIPMRSMSPSKDSHTSIIRDFRLSQSRFISIRAADYCNFDSIKSDRNSIRPLPTYCAVTRSVVAIMGSDKSRINFCLVS